MRDKKIFLVGFLGLFAALLICVPLIGPLGERGLYFATQQVTKDSMRVVGKFDFRCFDKYGNLKWEDLNRPNNLADEGEYMFLDVVLRAGTAPGGFYLRLYNTTPTETSTLTSITAYEPGATYGYAAQSLTRDGTGWPTLALDSGDYMATSATKTFSASGGGGWGPVTYCVLATSSNNTGKLMSYAALSQARTLADGESLQVTYKLKQQ